MREKIRIHWPSPLLQLLRLHVHEFVDMYSYMHLSKKLYVHPELGSLGICFVNQNTFSEGKF